VRQAARFLGVSRAKLLRWIHTGRLGAIDVAADGCSHPQYRILPRHLEAFEQARQTAGAPPRRRRKRIETVDYFPGD
jgi:excisionase family DNA binding protein